MFAPMQCADHNSAGLYALFSTGSKGMPVKGADVRGALSCLFANLVILLGLGLKLLCPWERTR